ncbi:hypothetical protein [Acetobacterium malicum]|nr:hypothetical protein [Acetobacterium dehalogenans]
MEVKSEYYTNLVNTLEKYDIPEEAVLFAGESLQTLEEMLFGFTIYLIS